MIKVYQLKALQNNYIVSVPFKGVKVRCEFKDGNIAKGIYARLYTNDPFKQMAIESSTMYGKQWVLVEKVREPEDDEQKPAKRIIKKLVVTKPADKPADETGTVQEAEHAEDAAEADTAQTEAEQTPAEETPEQEAEPADDGENKKEFANLAEAVMFIAANYGQQVESASQARKVLADNGIKATIHNG